MAFNDIRGKSPSSGIYGKSPASGIYGGFKKKTVPFIPTDISGLLFWFRSDTNVYTDAGTTPVSSDGDLVYQWNNSGSLATNLAQATEGNRPIYKVNIINGYPTIRFDGADNWMQTGAVVENQPLHFFCVMKWITSTDGYFCDGVSGSDRGAIWMTAATKNVQITAGASTAGIIYGTTSFNIVSAVFNGATSKHYMSNIAGEQTGNAGANNPGGLTLGSYRAHDSLYSNVDVAEFIIYNAEQTGTNRTKILNYLSGKYALGLS